MTPRETGVAVLTALPLYQLSTAGMKLRKLATLTGEEDDLPPCGAVLR